jgi:hypothetical protein
VNLGHRPSSLLEEEFLSAPIHSPPLSSRLISPSQLTTNADTNRPAWIILPARHPEPHASEEYMLSFARLHERGFNVVASQLLRGLCYYYDIEIHNFATNAILMRRPSSPSAKGFWASPTSGTCGFTSFVVNSSQCLLGRRACADLFESVGLRSHCERGGTTCTPRAT